MTCKNAILWEQLSGGEQFSRLVKMAWRVSRKGFPSACWINSEADAETCAAEAWLDVREMLAAAGADDVDLSVIVYRAACVAAKRIYRQERRAARAVSYDAPTEAGTGAAALLDSMTAAGALPTAATQSSTEETVELRDTLSRCAADDVDRRIQSALAAGLTQSETAAQLGVSQAAVSKRIRSMRDRIQRAAAL